MLTCASATPLLCGGECVDPTSDPANCGSCGHAIGAHQQCAQGTIECADSYASCAGSCVDFNNDANNCGSCGHACAAGLTCSAGCGAQLVSNGQTSCTTACAAVGTTCTYAYAKYDDATDGRTDGITVDCGIIPAASYDWPDNVWTTFMGMEYEGNYSGALTELDCTCVQ
jgi:hypothetical protein